MSKRFIATILAGALAIAGIAAQPAQAANDQLGKFLLGAATLVIIGAALQERQRADNKVVVHRAPQPRVIHKPHVNHGARAQYKVPKHKPKARQRALLPEYCLRTVHSHKGPRTIYGKRCLKNNYSAYHALPDQCSAIVRGPNGTRQGFRPGCLYRAGFRG